MTTTTTQLTKHFAAIEMGEGEAPRQAVERFMRAAAELDVKFHVLELFGPMTLGRARLIRFRTDAYQLDAIAKKLGRGFVVPTSNGYDAHVGGRKGRVNSSVMHEVSARPPQKYRGTRDQFWERQFLLN